MRNIFLIFMLGITCNMFAQQWSAGPELGVNIIPTNTSDLGQEFRLGWHAGGAISYEFSDRFSISSGVLASQKIQTYESYDTTQFTLFGFEALLDSNGLNRDVYSRTEGAVSQFYVELPVLASYSFNNLSFFGGPYIAYAFSVRRKETETIRTPVLESVDLAGFGLDPDNPIIGGLLPPASETNFEESSAKNGLRTLDIGFKVGVRYSFDKLNVAANYTSGLFDYETISGKDSKDVHSYFQLTVGYAIDFKWNK